MDLKSSIETFLSMLLDEYARNPLIAPYARTSDKPPSHFVHQHEVAARLASRNPVRALIGDEIGLGKTVTAIAVAKFLEANNRASRILIIVPRVLLHQWRRELARMGIAENRIKILERHSLPLLQRQNYPSAYYLASMDLLKRPERLVQVENAPWDLIIVDEAHKLGLNTLRFTNLGEKLITSHPERHVLLLSATPHRGDPRDYLERLRLVDPHLEDARKLNTRLFYELTHDAVLFRRTKEDVNTLYEGRQVFPPADFYACLIKATQAEAELVWETVKFLRGKLLELAVEKYAMQKTIIPLLTVLVFKRAASSPYAAYTTMQRMLAKRAGAAPDRIKQLVEDVKGFIGVDYDDYSVDADPDEAFNAFLEEASIILTEQDTQTISKLRDKAKSIMEAGDSKLSALTSLLENVLNEHAAKAIVFTEYKDTLDYIYTHLVDKTHPEWKRRVLRLSSAETGDPEKFKRIRERFENDPEARLLLATDVVAEGVNLQVAHVIVNYEIPWSLVKLEQRIGRVWRLGQQKRVEAYTLFMDNVADKAALEYMYQKLISLRDAALKPRPVTGQQILLYAGAEEITHAPAPVAVAEEKGKLKFKKVTEAKAILEYIKNDAAGLERLAASIIAAKQAVEREATSKGILHAPKNRENVEQALKACGFQTPSEITAAFTRLLKSAQELLGYQVQEENGTVKVADATGMPYKLNTINGYYGYLHRSTDRTSLTFAAYSVRSDTLAITTAKIEDARSILYTEPIG
ncbi:MAG: helicase-related protein, partial [Candidatus Bathyarchaeota archaeon]|nr:helicase-related protein [Candidatus Bathyarchaeota archaeon]